MQPGSAAIVMVYADASGSKGGALGAVGDVLEDDGSAVDRLHARSVARSVRTDKARAVLAMTAGDYSRPPHCKAARVETGCSTLEPFV